MPETMLAKKVPRSAITVRVTGIPTNPYRIQKIRPFVVTGAILPYPRINEA